MAFTVSALVLNGHRPNQSMPAHVGFWIDGRLVREVEVDATDLEGQVREYKPKLRRVSTCFPPHI